MKIAGFSIVRNAVNFDYPIVEAITSILPVCDAFYIAVGKSEDNTVELIRSINSPKINVIETIWDDAQREGGRVLASETNKAFDAIPDDYDWCFYIQGDEVIHESDLGAIQTGMEIYLHNSDVEGLLFKYRHFYGSYDFIGDSRKWYRNEVRIIRNNKSIRSYRDAQGFRIDNRKLRVKPIDAHVNHYGWVKPPEKQMAKQRQFHKMWHSDEHVEQMLGDAATFDYSDIDSLAKFKGTHPKIMEKRIQRLNWSFSHDISGKNLKPLDWILYLFERLTGIRIGEYKNYKRI